MDVRCALVHFAFSGTGMAPFPGLYAKQSAAYVWATAVERSRRVLLVKSFIMVAGSEGR
jgi:hypothetical protein